jgi:hypothetical protein
MNTKCIKKGVALVTLATAAMVTARGADYKYMTFEMKDGTIISIEATNLLLTFEGTTLNVGTETFTLINLSKMYFSTGNETTGISQIENGELKIDNSAKFYDLKGNKVSKDQMRNGIYIIKTKNGTSKLTIR